MRKTILLVAILALIVVTGGYAYSHGYWYGNGRTGLQGQGWQGMMGPGMMGYGNRGAGMMGYQGGTATNPEAGRPYTPEEWNQAIKQMQDTCGAFMGYNQGTDL